MKRILRLLIFISVFAGSANTVLAQTEIDIDPNGRTYSQIFDSLSTGLIPARIPYGTLYDRVYGWSGLDTWQTGDTTSMAQLFQSWYDAEKSVMNPLLRPNNYDSMRKVVQQQVFQVKLPVIAINYQFGYFDSTAVSDGRLSEVNGILTDNQQASPYLSKRVTIAGIGTEKVVVNKSYALQYSNFLMLNNTGIAIQSIVVNNITQGGQYTLSMGIPQSIQFTQAGNNILKFTVNATGSSYVSYQIIYVESDGTGAAYRPMGTMGVNCTPTNELLESTIPFKGYAETQATNSFADYHIYYHTTTSGGDCEKVLKKPIIILDGFDPGNDRSYKDLYNNFLINQENLTSLGDQLRDKGHDVIILNFPKLGEPIYGETGEPNITIPSLVKVNGTTQTMNMEDRDGGADYVERNAFLLVKLIQQVNNTLANNGSTEKIVIVGPSMGGLISRYALAYMEKKQAEGAPDMDHNCRLWVSFDSPHEGANIPLSVQKNLDFFGFTGEIQDAKDKFMSKLRVPAARQMLIEQTDGLKGNSPFYTTFFTNLKANGLPGSNGFPVNLRKVTLLNGAGNGIGTYSPGVEILNGEARKTFLNLKIFEVIDNFLPAYAQFSRVVKQRIAVKGFLSIPSFITLENSITNPNPHGSMDASPGSTFNATEETYDGFYKGLVKEKARQTWNPIKRYHSFIPTISALGFKNSSFDWNTRVDDRNLVCNNEIYFDNYYIPPTNQEHIYLNTNNVNWLTEEIEKGQPNCPTICSYTITGGDSRLCLNNTYTYTLDEPVPPGATTVWEPSTNLQILSSTYNSVTVKALSNGTASLTAIINNPCGSGVTLKKEGIPLGTEKPGPIDWTWDLPPRRVSFQVDPIPGATSYQWYLNGTLKATTSESVYRMPMAGNVSCGNYYYFGVRAVGSCGTSDESYVYAEMPPCYFGYKISPNPVGDYINIEPINHDDKSGNKTAAAIHTIEIYDKMGVMRLRKKLSTLQAAAKISVASLANDVYNLRIYDGQSWQSYKIIVQH